MDSNATALSFFQTLSYGYASEHAIRARYGYALHLSGSALGRFGQVAGWLTGLAHAGKADLAARLADDFDRTLRGALRGCEDTDMNVHRHNKDDAPDGSIRAPRMKLVLTDDGTFGGFGLAWYRAVSNVERIKRARALDEEAYSSGDLPADQAGRRWSVALDAADTALHIRRDIEEVRYYRPAWATDDTPSYMRSISEIVHYGFAYNGGLLYHGPGGGEVFAATVGDVRGWSTHT